MFCAARSSCLLVVVTLDDAHQWSDNRPRIEKGSISANVVSKCNSERAHSVHDDEARSRVGTRMIWHHMVVLRSVNSGSMPRRVELNVGEGVQREEDMVAHKHPRPLACYTQSSPLEHMAHFIARFVFRLRKRLGQSWCYPRLPFVPHLDPQPYRYTMSCRRLPTDGI